MRKLVANDLTIPISLLLRVDINTTPGAVLAELAPGQIVLVEENERGVHAGTEELLRALPNPDRALAHNRDILPALTVTTPQTGVDALIAGMFEDPVQRWYLVERERRAVGVIPPMFFAVPARLLLKISGESAGTANILGLYGSPVTPPLSVCYRCEHAPTPHILSSSKARLQPGYPHDVRCPEDSEVVMRRHNPCQ